MFIHTQAALGKIVSDIKRISFIYNLLSPIITVAYLIYACFAGTGLLAVNITLAALTAIWLTLSLSFRSNKKLLNKSRHIINRLKIATKAFSLGVAIYGIYLANDKTTVFTVLFAAVNLLTWMLQLAFELLSSYAELQFALIAEGLKMDSEALSKPIRAVEGAFNRVIGKEVEDTPLTADAEKRRALLSKKVEKIKEEKRSRKPESKIEKFKKKILSLKSSGKGESDK